MLKHNGYCFSETNCNGDMIMSYLKRWRHNQTHVNSLASYSSDVDESTSADEPTTENNHEDPGNTRSFYSDETD